MSIIEHTFIQVEVCKFLFDYDLIEWKKTCRFSYYFKHDIIINNINATKNKNVLKNTKIKEIDVNNYVSYPDHLSYDCICGRSKFRVNNFDLNTFQINISYLKVLKLTFMNQLCDKQLGKLVSRCTSLEYLDLGINTYLPDYCFIALTNIKTLYLRNNYNTKAIFQYLPNLRLLQIASDDENILDYIHPEDVPNYVSYLIQIEYSYDCSMGQTKLCEPYYPYEKKIIILRHI